MPSQDLTSAQSGALKRERAIWLWRSRRPRPPGRSVNLAGKGLATVVALLLIPMLLACSQLGSLGLSAASPNTQSTSAPAKPLIATRLPLGAPPTLPPSPTPLPPQLIQEADAEEQLLINLYQRVSPSVVSIRALKELTEFQHPRLPQGIPTPELPDIPFQESGEGSGFVVDTAGHIVTNHHVVEDTSELQVVFFDGSTLAATVVGSDPDSDLAVLKVEAPPESLRPVVWGDSDRVQVGQRAIAIGNPFGYENTLTSGIISGLSRSLPASTGYRIPEIIQTDAAINPGNSGGPLLNSQGEVIGINTAIVPSFNQFGERGFLGIGFAIPANQARRVVQALIETGEYEHPWFGFSGMDVTPEIALEMGLAKAEGALVIRVIAGSPADEAGLRGGDHEISVMGQKVTVGGDVIIAINDDRVRRFDDILTYLSRKGQVGQRVQVTFIRDGKTQTLSVTLGRRPASAPSR